MVHLQEMLQLANTRNLPRDWVVFRPRFRRFVLTAVTVLGATFLVFFDLLQTVINREDLITSQTGISGDEVNRVLAWGIIGLLGIILLQSIILFVRQRTFLLILTPERLVVIHKPKQRTLYELNFKQVATLRVQTMGGLNLPFLSHIRLESVDAKGVSASWEIPEYFSKSSAEITRLLLARYAIANRSRLAQERSLATHSSVPSSSQLPILPQVRAVMEIRNLIWDVFFIGALSILGLCSFVSGAFFILIDILSFFGIVKAGNGSNVFNPTPHPFTPAEELLFLGLLITHFTIALTIIISILVNRIRSVNRKITAMRTDIVITPAACSLVLKSTGQVILELPYSLFVSIRAKRWLNSFTIRYRLKDKRRGELNFLAGTQPEPSALFQLLITNAALQQPEVVSRVE